MKEKALPHRRKNPGSSIEGAPTEKLSSRSGEEQSLDTQLEDDNDGYYDDIVPADAGAVRPGMDREMIKKIILLVVGALLLIGLCVVLMTVL